MDLQPGDKAPPFKLATDNGSEVSLYQLRGQPFVLYFYPQDNTSGCTKEAVGFSKLSKKFWALGILVIGVSKDCATSHERFKTKHKLKLILGSDPEIKTAQAYGVWVEKNHYGRRYMGIEHSTFLVDAAGNIHQIWRQMKVPGHAEAVFAAAKSL